MSEYTVTWEIDLNADSPVQAAKLARKFQLDPQSWATVFSVVDADGNDTTVDLEEVTS